MILSPLRAQNSARRWLAKVQFIAQRGASSKMLLIFLFSTKSLGHVCVTEDGWYKAEDDYTFYLGNFEISDITESDRWGRQRMIPEPSTATLSLPALAGLATRPRK